MDNDQLVEDFFRSLRIALTNAFSYSKDHPYFIKSVENFKLKLEAILVVLNPLKIGVTSLGLVVDGKSLTRIGFYDELARLLHQRKIKSIEISDGVNLQELVKFLSIISLSQKEIFKNGGLVAILEKERLIHFIIQELDYSALLQTEGKECTDIWKYMLKEAVYSNDAAKIGQFADIFGSLIKRIDMQDLIDAEDVPVEINEFLISLRNKNKEKFDKCMNDVFLWLLHNKKTLNPAKLVKFKSVFNGISQEDFFALLKEGFLQEDNFDFLSLQLFSKISEQKEPHTIVKDFFSTISQSQELKNNSVVVKKVQNLLNSSQDDILSAVYRNTLESLAEGISLSGKLHFDHELLRENYCYIVLGILATDENTITLEMAATVLEKELVGMLQKNKIGLLKDLWDVLAKRKKENLKACIDLEKNLSSFIENIVLNSGLTFQQEFLLEMVLLPSGELNLYLDKIFTAEKVDKQVLNLFLRLFQNNLEAFYERLDKNIHDTEFFGSLTDALGQLDTPVTLSILEHIYLSANELIKLESLKAMRKLKKVDTAFLMRQLNASSSLLKSRLVSVLILDEQAKNDVLGMLFKIPSFLGNKNSLLIENMEIAFNLRFIAAISYIKDFSCRRFFWNNQLRNKAAQILKEWNVS